MDLVYFSIRLSGTTGWGCRITPTASLQRGKIPTTSVLAYDTRQSDGEASSNARVLGNAEYSFIAIAPRSTLARSGST